MYSEINERDVKVLHVTIQYFRKGAKFTELLFHMYVFIFKMLKDDESAHLPNKVVSLDNDLPLEKKNNEITCLWDVSSSVHSFSSCYVILTVKERHSYSGSIHRVSK